MQVVAWAKMFHDYSAVMPAVQALKLTFDGSAPCNLCTVAQAGQDGARDQLPAGAALTDGAKLILALHASPELVLKAPGELWPGLAHEVGRTRGERVPVPPPRA